MAVKLAGIEVAERIHVDRKTGMVIAIDLDAGIRWYDGNALRSDFTGTTAKRNAFHYPNRLLVAIPDIAAFVQGAKRIDERAMQWTAGDANSLYREAVRFGDRVMIAWGRNNARDLQTIGIATTEADAKALVASFRDNPLKGFKPTSPYFVEGRGGISRTYHPIKDAKITGAIGECLDGAVEWTTKLPEYEYDKLSEQLDSEAAAERRYDELELSWYQRGGAPSEIEWMKRLQRRRYHTVFDWFNAKRGASPDPAGLLRELLREAGIEVPAVLPEGHRELYLVVEAIPQAHWVRLGERAGKLTRKLSKKVNAEILLDESLFVVATVTKAKQMKVKVKRLASLELARAHFEATVAK